MQDDQVSQEDLGDAIIEEWKPCVGWEGWYEVSSSGRVRRIRSRYGNPQNKLLKGFLVHGYPTVNLRAVEGLDKRRSAVATHILVARAFLGPCPKGFEVDHKDFDRANSALSNLEYVTHGENNLRAFKSGRQPVSSEKHGKAKLSYEKVEFIRQSSLGPTELSRMFGVKPGTVYLAKKGKTWKTIT